jgi:DNA-binding transcriptional LysR family regulator
MPDSALSPTRFRTLDLELLRSFVQVVETGGFTRAGERLGKSQSAVSLQLRRLEDQLGTRLMLRDPHRITLTAPGEALLVQARRLLRMNDEIIAGLEGDDLEGEVRFGAPEDFATAYLPEILGQFTRSHPNVQLNVTCDLTLNLLDAMGQGRLDLALIKRDAMGPDLGVRVWREPLVWVGASRDILERSGPLAVIAAPAPCVYRRRALTALDEAGLDWRIAYTSPSLAGQHAALRAGLGVTALPRDMTPSDLVVLDPALPELRDTEIALIMARGEPTQGAARLASAVRQAIERRRQGQGAAPA